MYLEAFCCCGNWWLIITCMETEIYILLWRNENFLGKDISYFIKTDVRKWACQGNQCPPGGWRWGQGWSQLLTGNTASVRCLFDSLRTLNSDIFCELWLYLRSSEGVGKWQWWRSGCVLPFCHQLLWKKGGRGEGNYNQTEKDQTKKDQTKITKIVFVWRLTKEIQVKVKRVYNWVGEIGNCKV